MVPLVFEGEEEEWLARDTSRGRSSMDIKYYYIYIPPIIIILIIYICGYIAAYLLSGTSSRNSIVWV